MNQLMTLERSGKVEIVPRIVAPRRSDRTFADCSCDDIAVTALSRFRPCHHFELKRLLCEVREGNLIIRGQVSSYYLKQLAQETVRSLPSVNRIFNRVEVDRVQINRREIEIQEEKS